MIDILVVDPSYMRCYVGATVHPGLKPGKLHSAELRTANYQRVSQEILGLEPAFEGRLVIQDLDLEYRIASYDVGLGFKGYLLGTAAAEDKHGHECAHW